MRRWMSALVLASVLPGIPAAMAQPLPGDPAAGLELAREQCRECHYVERNWADLQVMFAPDFVDIAASDHTEVSLKVFFRTPHQTMPNIILTDRERDDIIAYILSLKKK